MFEGRCMAMLLMNNVAPDHSKHHFQFIFYLIVVMFANCVGISLRCNVWHTHRGRKDNAHAIVYKRMGFRYTLHAQTHIVIYDKPSWIILIFFQLFSVHFFFSSIFSLINFVNWAYDGTIPTAPMITSPRLVGHIAQFTSKQKDKKYCCLRLMDGLITNHWLFKAGNFFVLDLHVLLILISFCIF